MMGDQLREIMLAGHSFSLSRTQAGVVLHELIQSYSQSSRSALGAPDDSMPRWASVPYLALLDFIQWVGSAPQPAGTSDRLGRLIYTGHLRTPLPDLDAQLDRYAVDPSEPIGDEVSLRQSAEVLHRVVGVYVEEVALGEELSYSGSTSILEVATVHFREWIQAYMNDDPQAAFERALEGLIEPEDEASEEAAEEDSKAESIPEVTKESGVDRTEITPPAAPSNMQTRAGRREAAAAEREARRQERSAGLEDRVAVRAAATEDRAARRLAEVEERARKRAERLKK
jgi:hypothetical protein